MPYLTPDEIPEDDLCRPLFIPNSTAWLAIVSGALTELTLIWNWEQFGTLTPEECVERMQLMVAQYYDEFCSSCELPEGSPVTRLSEIGEWEELSGDEWVDPTGDRAVPTLPPIDAPTDEERRCLAAWNAASVLKDFYEVVTDAFGEELTLEQMIVAAAEALTIRVGVWLGLLVAGEGILLFGILASFYALMEFITMDLWTEEFDDKLRCLLLYHAGNVGETVVFDFNAFREDLVLQTNWFDPTFSEVRLLGQLLYLTGIIGSEGLNAAGATTVITEADCAYCTEWCYEWNEGDGEDGWTSPFGNYDGSKWVSTYDSSNDVNAILLVRSVFMPTGHSVNYEEMDYTRSVSFAGAVLINVDGEQCVITSPQSGTITCSVDKGNNDTIQFQLLVHTSNVGTATVTRFRFSGIGVNPFVTGDCP